MTHRVVKSSEQMWGTGSASAPRQMDGASSDGWVRVALECPGDGAHAVEEALSAAGAIAVSLEDGGEEPRFESWPPDRALWGRVRVRGLFPAGVDGVGRLAGRLPPEVLETARVSSLPDADWARAGQERFKPMRFGERLWISPTWAEPPPEAGSGVVVRLDPGPRVRHRLPSEHPSLPPASRGPGPRGEARDRLWMRFRDPRHRGARARSRAVPCRRHRSTGPGGGSRECAPQPGDRSIRYHVAFGGRRCASPRGDLDIGHPGRECPGRPPRRACRDVRGPRGARWRIDTVRDPPRPGWRTGRRHAHPGSGWRSWTAKTNGFCWRGLRAR